MELLLIVMVLAIAAAIAAPLVAETGATKVQAAARLLLADVQFTQSAALARPDTPYGLRFEQDGSGYEVVQGAGGAAFDCSAAAVVTNAVDRKPYVTEYGTGRAVQLGGVTVDAYALDGDDCLAFGSYGETDQGAAATVTLRAGSKTVTVTIDPVDGKVGVDAVVESAPPTPTPQPGGGSKKGKGGTKSKKNKKGKNKPGGKNGKGKGGGKGGG